MIAKDETRTLTLRAVKSAMKYLAIERKAETLSDADTFSVIQKQVKQRRESIDQFTKAGRQDLADKEIKEMVILEAYLPKAVTDAELEALIKEEIQKSGASSKKDFGRVMKALSEHLAGRADGKRISETLGKYLK